MPIKDLDLRRKYMHERYKKIHPNAKNAGKHHGLRHLSAYRSWTSMKMRCDWSNWRKYKYWGGRGIKYDPKWSSFEIFLQDMGERPEGTTLDRINNNKDYTKENCRWTTITEQNRNRNNVKIKPEIAQYADF